MQRRMKDPRKWRRDCRWRRFRKSSSVSTASDAGAVVAEPEVGVGVVAAAAVFEPR